jgi:hypothetical protein
VMVCDRCGVEIQELGRKTYQPRFDPHGCDRFRMPITSGSAGSAAEWPALAGHP